MWTILIKRADLSTPRNFRQNLQDLTIFDVSPSKELKSSPENGRETAARTKLFHSLKLNISAGFNKMLQIDPDLGGARVGRTSVCLP